MIDRIEEKSRAIETPSQDSGDRLMTNQVHPFVYRAIALLAIWFVLAAWGFFAPAGYVGFALAVVSAFVLVAVSLPFVLSRFAKKRDALDATTKRPGSLREWLAGDVDTWQARLGARDAIVAILLPLLAGAAGMTAFAIVLHFAVRSGV